MTEVQVKFSEWLSDNRTACAMTMETVAKKISSHKGYISGMENQKVNPPSTTVCKRLGKLFNFDPDYVIYIAYRDKAPQAVQIRIDLLESLREKVQQLVVLEVYTGDPSKEAEKTAVSKMISELLDKLNRMYDTETGKPVQASKLG